jgi:hypothetical protein
VGSLQRWAVPVVERDQTVLGTEFRRAAGVNALDFDLLVTSARFSNAVSDPQR